MSEYEAMLNREVDDIELRNKKIALHRRNVQMELSIRRIDAALNKAKLALSRLNLTRAQAKKDAEMEANDG